MARIAPTAASPFGERRSQLIRGVGPTGTFVETFCVRARTRHGTRSRCIVRHGQDEDVSTLDELELTATSLGGSFCRFHSATHFHASPEQYYMNFLATPRSFERRDRFAPKGSHCGFYFASSEFVASAEALFYAGASDETLRHATSTDVFEAYVPSKRRIFLRVDLEIDNVADLTDWENVRALFNCGLLRWSRGTPESQVQYLACLIAPNPGGSDITDAAGWALFQKGFTAVRFPSVRALLAAGPAPVPGGIRQFLDDIRNMSAAENVMDLGWQAVEQMQAEANLVVFSDITLMQSISRYSWCDDSGRGEENVVNPYYGRTARELEEVRLHERARRGYPAVGVAKTREELTAVLSTGLLSDAERAGEFYCNVAFIRTPR